MFCWLSFGSSAVCPILLGQVNIGQRSDGILNGQLCGIPELNSSKYCVKPPWSRCTCWHNFFYLIYSTIKFIHLLLMFRNNGGITTQFMWLDRATTNDNMDNSGIYHQGPVVKKDPFRNGSFFTTGPRSLLNYLHEFLRPEFLMQAWVCNHVKHQLSRKKICCRHVKKDEG